MKAGIINLNSGNLLSLVSALEKCGFETTIIDQPSDDFDVLGFKEKILQFQPKMVCFNGKKAGAVYLNTKTKHVSYGLQTTTIGNTKLYIAPSTSGSARRFWDESYWMELN